jgi:hypothetical protein
MSRSTFTRPADRQPKVLTVHVQLKIDIDLDVATSTAEQRGASVDTIIGEILGDLECRAADSAKWRDAVVRVGSSVWPAVSLDRNRVEGDASGASRP